MDDTKHANPKTIDIQMNTMQSPGFGVYSVYGDKVGLEDKTSHNGERVDAKSKENINQESWGEVWQEFCENTTVHGVSKVVEPTPFTLRK